MPELGPYGSVRGAAGNSRPYRERPATARGDASWLSTGQPRCPRLGRDQGTSGHADNALRMARLSRNGRAAGLWPLGTYGISTLNSVGLSLRLLTRLLTPQHAELESLRASLRRHVVVPPCIHQRERAAKGLREAGGVVAPMGSPLHFSGPSSANVPMMAVPPVPSTLCRRCT